MLTCHLYTGIGVSQCYNPITYWPYFTDGYLGCRFHQETNPCIYGLPSRVLHLPPLSAHHSCFCNSKYINVQVFSLSHNLFQTFMLCRCSNIPRSNVDLLFGWRIPLDGSESPLPSAALLAWPVVPFRLFTRLSSLDMSCRISGANNQRGDTSQSILLKP